MANDIWPTGFSNLNTVASGSLFLSDDGTANNGYYTAAAVKTFVSIAPTITGAATNTGSETFTGATPQLTLGVQQTTQGGLVFANTAAGAYATTVQGSNSSSAAWTMTLPPNAGTNTYVLQTNGSGVTSWVAPAPGVAGSSGQIQYNSSGAFAGLASVTTAAGQPLIITAQASTDVPLTVTGAASQSANLTTWTNSSSTTLASISSAGLFSSASNIRFGGISTYGSLAFNATGFASGPTTTISSSAGYGYVQAYGLLDINNSGGIGNLLNGSQGVCIASVCALSFNNNTSLNGSNSYLDTNLWRDAATTFAMRTTNPAAGHTVTISIASPAVVTWSFGHGLGPGTAFQFSTTGALPTGVTAATTYYILAPGLTTTQFQFSATAGGSAINTSGSQSGTQTVTVLAIPYKLSVYNLYADASDYERGVFDFQGVSNVLRIGTEAAGTGGARALRIITGGTTALTVSTAQSVIVGTAALSTSATDGFLYIPTCAGVPSGTPTTQTGTVALVYDTTDNKVYVYNGAWKAVALS